MLCNLRDQKLKGYTIWYANCFFSIEGKIALRKLKQETPELEHALVLELVNKDQNILMINWTRLALYIE